MDVQEKKRSFSEQQAISPDEGIENGRNYSIAGVCLGNMFTYYCKRQTSSVKSSQRHSHFHSDEKMSCDMIDHLPSNFPDSSCRAKSLFFQDNEAVMRMSIKGRSPSWKHAFRTQFVDLD